MSSVCLSKAWTSGGMQIAREYIEKARALGASEMFCDTIGIIATKLSSFS